jgi:hypothetical protein
MTRTLVCALLAITAPLAFAWAQQDDKADASNTIAGAWQMVSYNYGKSGRLPKGSKEVKLISGKHFAWVLYSNKGITLANGGGTFSLTGNSYVEHLDYADRQDSPLIGHDQRFTINLSSDTMKTAGVLSNGIKVSETWNKIE